MPETTGRDRVGVDFRQPVTIRIVACDLRNLVERRLVCELVVKGDDAQIFWLAFTEGADEIPYYGSRR